MDDETIPLNDYKIIMNMQNNAPSDFYPHLNQLTMTGVDVRLQTSFSNSKEYSKIINLNLIDESIPFEKSDICYNFMKSKEPQQQNNNKLLTSSINVVNSTQGLIENEASMKRPEPRSGPYEKNKNLDRSNSSIITPHNTTVSKVQKINGRKQQSDRQDSFSLNQVYTHPKEIGLPKQKEIGEQNIVPCTLSQANKSIANNKSQSIKNQEQKVRQQNQQLSSSKISTNEKNKIVTDMLLQKINELENKVKSLEEEKKKNEELAKTGQLAQYTSTPQSPALPVYGSIKRNEIIKKFSTVNESQQNNTQFRLRNVGNRSSSTENKIHSNIYSVTLMQNKNNPGLKEQIDLLKKKLYALQASHRNHQERSIRSNIKQTNIKTYENKPQEKLCAPNRRQLGGKIVKRGASNFPQSPQHSFRTNTEQSMFIQGGEKEFIRSGPQRYGSSQDSRTIQVSRSSNVFDQEGSQQKKRADSSAIFRKNPGPALIQKKVPSMHQFSKSNTIQFNPDKQKFIVLDSKETEPRNQSMIQQYSSEILIPNLNPSPRPQSSSDDLIQIGKITFKKLGCSIYENTTLNVKKFKNCVLFTISNEENILWHYQGRFYYGGWRTYSNGEGQKYGKGVEFVPGKYKYKGSFQEGKRSGYGTMVGDNGSVYIGQWFDGAKQGRGKQIEADGTEYDGEWKSGRKSGYGKQFFKGILQFEGNFVGGLKNGFGKQYFENGDYYEGEYLNNKFQGKGTYKWASRAIYTGDFRDGKRHGQGIWRSGEKNYDSYEGQYQNDNKNGYGIYKWSNGAFYKGNFKNDLKHGEGSITYENGKTMNMVWNKGNVQKTLNSSQFVQQPQSRNLISTASKTKLRKISATKSNHNLQSLQSAKSLKSQRSMPKGLSLKRQIPIQSSPKSSPKVQFRSKFHSSEASGTKTRLSQLSGRQSGLVPKQATGRIKDPPYRGMQTSSNINMNI